MTLTPEELERLKKEYAAIGYIHFDHWGLSMVWNPKEVSYFQGSYKTALKMSLPAMAKLISDAPSVDKALVANPGGIDLNTDKLNLEVRGNMGEAVELKIGPGQLENLNFDGLVPNIMTMTPMTNLPLFLSGDKIQSSTQQLSMSQTP